MMEMINKEALLKQLEATSEDATAQFMAVTLRGIVNEMPAVDAVPVIRCAECDFHDPENRKAKGKNSYYCYWFKRWMSAGGYCSNAVRTEDEHDGE